MRDTLATHAYAMKQGHEEGLQQGLKEGIAQGMQQGALNEKLRIATNLLAVGLSIKDVAAATGLSEKDIENIRN